jgi:hypothetical protein
LLLQSKASAMESDDPINVRHAGSAVTLPRSELVIRAYNGS